MTEREVTTYAITYRGLVLNNIVKLEKLMDVFLSRYFTTDPKKVDELFLLVFAGLRITFENKRGILDYLIKNDRIDIQKTYPKISLDMQDLFSDRKVLAHYLVDLSDESLLRPDGEIVFISHNNKLDYKIFNREKIQDIEMKTKRMVDIFMEKEFGVSDAPL